MNDLDKKIAELMGYSVITAAEYLELTGREAFAPQIAIRQVAPGATILASERGHEGWSISDSKALELVDELGRDHPARMWNHFFRLDQLEIGQGWRAVFWEDLKGRMIPPRKFTGQGMTRPEAICRAYIAAMKCSIP